MGHLKSNLTAGVIQQEEILALKLPIFSYFNQLRYSLTRGMLEVIEKLRDAACKAQADAAAAAQGLCVPVLDCDRGNDSEVDGLINDTQVSDGDCALLPSTRHEIANGKESQLIHLAKAEAACSTTLLSCIGLAGSLHCQ